MNIEQCFCVMHLRICLSTEIKRYKSAIRIRITVHSRIGIRTHHLGNSTSLHSSCAASTDYQRTVTVIAKAQQPSGPSSSSPQPTSYVVVDDQQPGTTRQMILNPTSVAPSHQESQDNTTGLSSLFAAIPSVLTYQQMDTPQPFSPSQLQPAPSPVSSSTHHEHSRPPSQSSKQRQSQPK